MSHFTPHPKIGKTPPACKQSAKKLDLQVFSWDQSFRPGHIHSSWVFIFSRQQKKLCFQGFCVCVSASIFTSPSDFELVAFRHQDHSCLIKAKSVQLNTGEEVALPILCIGATAQCCHSFCDSSVKVSEKGQERASNSHMCLVHASEHAEFSPQMRWFGFGLFFTLAVCGPLQLAAQSQAGPCYCVTLTFGCYLPSHVL